MALPGSKDRMIKTDNKEMKVRYLGPKAEVSTDGTREGTVFPIGKAVSVPESLGKRLVAQGGFEEAK